MNAERPQHEEVILVDFGSQTAHLIARRVREHQVFCRIVPPHTKAEQIRSDRLRGVILSGGPASVYDANAPTLDPEFLELGVPVLGICYGLQILSKLLGLEVRPAQEREFGHREIEFLEPAHPLFAGLPAAQVVWMSHGDQIAEAGSIFRALARTDTCPVAAVQHRDRPLYGVQFHPEVSHTRHGSAMLGRFLRDVCGCRGDWKMGSLVDELTEKIRARIGPDGVALCGVSGGIDSTVAAALVHRAIGDRLHLVFVDNGLLRERESEEVEDLFRHHLKIPFRRMDAGARFLASLKGVTDPEVKRKRIGHDFIQVFEEVQREARLSGAKFLVQGTLYPDVIESVSAHGGPSTTIKTHHNVGGLPADLRFELVEPLRDLFKDEVRRLGRELGLSDRLVNRQPFPGPGLAVRVLGEVTEERLKVLRKADAVVREEIAAAGLEDGLWQWFAVLLPVQSVGVMGDGRTYEHVCAVRIVESLDAMTAEWARVPHETLAKISRRIVNEVRGINRVVYDISSKPPATIEWE